MKTKNFLHIIALLIYFSSHSQVNFITELSKNQLGINERLKVEFKIDKDGDNFVPPNFENFRTRNENRMDCMAHFPGFQSLHSGI